VTAPKPVPIGRRVLAGIGALVVIAAIGTAGWHGYHEILAAPVKRVVFAGDLDRLSHAELDALAQAIQAAPPGSVTLATVREAAKRVPWVREATVRRQFPDAVEITFERRFSPGGAPPAESAMVAGDKLLGRQVMSLAIDGAGKVSGCKVVAASGDTGLTYGCEDVAAEHFATSAPATAAAERQGYMTILVYGHTEHVV